MIAGEGNNSLLIHLTGIRFIAISDTNQQKRKIAGRMDLSAFSI